MKIYISLRQAYSFVSKEFRGSIDGDHAMRCYEMLCESGEKWGMDMLYEYE